MLLIYNCILRLPGGIEERAIASDLLLIFPKFVHNCIGQQPKILSQMEQCNGFATEMLFTILMKKKVKGLKDVW